MLVLWTWTEKQLAHGHTVVKMATRLTARPHRNHTYHVFWMWQPDLQTRIGQGLGAQCDGFRVILQQSGRWWWRKAMSPGRSTKVRRCPRVPCPDISRSGKATSTLLSCQEPRPEGPVKRLGSCFHQWKERERACFWLTFLLLLCPCGSWRTYTVKCSWLDQHSLRGLLS